MDIRFDCTRCGKCCHDLRLPLSVDEAISWAGRGHQVQFLCDSLLALATGPFENSLHRYRAERSFTARSGALPVRINVILVAAFSGACPHLRADMRCGDYERRPRVCRIYPAEIVPDIAIEPRGKACPPEAWGDEQPLLMRGGALVSDETRRLIEEHRAVMLTDIPAKAMACDLLGVRRAALAGEGYTVHSPSPEATVATLLAAKAATLAANAEQPWSIVTNRQQTLRMLREAEADGGSCRRGDDYLGFFADEPCAAVEEDVARPAYDEGVSTPVSSADHPALESVDANHRAGVSDAG